MLPAENQQLRYCPYKWLFVGALNSTPCYLLKKHKHSYSPFMLTKPPDTALSGVISAISEVVTAISGGLGVEESDFFSHDCMTTLKLTDIITKIKILVNFFVTVKF